VSKRRRPRTVITKAASRPAITPAATFTAEQVQALLGAQTATVGPINPLPRAPMVPFGPGTPVIPAPIDPPRDDGSGRPAPRIYEYPVSVNLPGVTDRLVPWKMLRDAGEAPLIRDCIRIRKNQIATIEWDIVVSKRALQQYRAMDPDTSSVKIQRELRAKLDPEVSRLVEFWQYPDFEQDETFPEWAGKALEEHMVLDALAIWPFQDRAGKRQGLRVIDGTTIKVLRSESGGRPMPPFPAYQQLLWGFPRGEFIADVKDDGEIANGFTADRLIYQRREVRTWTPYGLSQVEQALQDLDLYLRRMEWDKAQYTDGVQPAGWLTNDGLDTWTPQQLADYNRAFNDLLSGKTSERMRHWLLPPGINPVEAKEIGEKYSPDYHLHLIKLVAMHLDTTIAELGFTEAKGLGSSGYHEGQADVSERKATNPTLRWFQAILTTISRTHLGMPLELEFRFLGLDPEDETAADEALERQLRSGQITWNEAREQGGRAPYSFPEADMPWVETSNQKGLVFADGSSVPDPVEELVPGVPPNPVEGTGQKEPEKDTEQAPDEAVKAEVAAYRKWARNGHSTRRPFLLKHITRDQAVGAGIDPARVTFPA
jgi:hypothetical protein